MPHSSTKGTNSELLKGHVQLVVCMDTEGPAVDPARADILRDWSAVGHAMDKLFASGFRNALPDKAGGGLRLGWFFLNWTGFRTNPMQRDLGYHKVRDYYLARWGEQIARSGDEECWHYHQPGPTGAANEWGLDWAASREYDAVISRQILERDWFPVCYRAGGTIMSPCSSRWVDAWFPVDYSNRAPLKFEDTFDWSGGVDDWSVYHPDPEDFRRSGPGRRHMARCMDLDTRAYRLSDEDIRATFERARAGKNAVISVFEHDYRDIEPKLSAFIRRFGAVAASYPDIDWRYAAPVEAVNRYLGAPSEPGLQLDAGWHGGVLRIASSRPLFQSIPWIAVRTEAGDVVHEERDIVRVDATHWTWTPRAGAAAAELAVAGSTANGSSAVLKCRPGDSLAAMLQKRPWSGHPKRPHSIWEHSKPFLAISDARASGALDETDSVRQARGHLERHLQPGMTILDVGCAAGHAARTLSPKGFQYFGIDPCERVIDIGRPYLGEIGVPEGNLRALAVEELPAGETYDAVVCLNVLLYFAEFRLPLAIMARAARHQVVLRAGFGERTEVRFLADVLLEPGFQGMRAYFNVFDRAEVQSFLEREGFEVTWAEDERQARVFGGAPECVGGIPLPYAFLFAERVRPAPSESEVQGSELAAAAKMWTETGKGGANP